MNKKILSRFGFFVLLVLPAAQASEVPKVPLEKVYVNMKDTESLQRGARLFMNFCLSCHSAQYMRYNRMAADLGIPEDVLKENLLFAGDKPGDLMRTTMPKADAREWFGTAPPDLTLAARVRKPDWIYTFLKSFYLEEKSPSGWNNTLFENVAMPHILYELQGSQRAVFKSDEHGVKTFERFELEKAGTMTPEQYDGAMRDLTNFLVYMAEPIQMRRYRIGALVLLFLGIFGAAAYLLKKEYWKDVH
jgi:ubiquinol-cytochrome c reductase cytochrome c1 subunit